MNILGKLCVLLYGAGSIFCLIVGMTVYTQPMDFAPLVGGDGKKAVARVEVSIARTNELIRSNYRAHSRWSQEYDEVVKQEVDQINRRLYYLGQLELVRTGKLDGKPVSPAVQKLSMDDTTRLLLIDKPTGRTPWMVGPGPMDFAEPQAVYLDGLEQAKVAIKAAVIEKKELLDQHEKFGGEINGTEMPVVSKGFRRRIKEQERIEEDADAERVYLEDFVTNRRADAELYVKRRDAVQASIEQLTEYNKKKFGTAGN